MYANTLSDLKVFFSSEVLTTSVIYVRYVIYKSFSFVSQMVHSTSQEKLGNVETALSCMDEIAWTTNSLVSKNKRVIVIWY